MLILCSPRRIPLWRPMARALPGVAIAALALAALGFPAQSQDKPRRDTGGKVMDLSKWHAIKPHEFMLNIVDLTNVEHSTGREDASFR